MLGDCETTQTFGKLVRNHGRSPIADESGGKSPALESLFEEMNELPGSFVCEPLGMANIAGKIVNNSEAFGLGKVAIGKNHQA